MKKIILIIIICLFTAFAVLEGYGYYLSSRNFSVSEESENPEKIVKENTALKNKIKNLAPKGLFIVIDTAQNRLYLQKGTENIRTAIASCGSGNVLEDPSGKRKWVFDTPKGEFAVKYKKEKPVWIKPDWAFIEEGEEPPKKYNDRIETGVLGDYAIGFGNGFFIHGTLYTRLLGRNVSHGCVRMGDEDIKAVYKSSIIGTKIYIY